MSMDETNKTNEGTPQTTGQSSQGGSGNTPTKETPRTYTETEAQKMVSDALAAKGREHKTALDAITKERDTFKTQIDSITGELESLKSEREELEASVDQLSVNDPDKKKLTAALKENAEAARKLKADRLDLEADKQTHAEEVQMAKETRLEADCWEVAGEYEGGDAVKLKTLATLAKTTTREEVTALAATIWAKKASTEKVLSGAPDSGATSGGSGIMDYNKLTPEEKIDYGLKHPPKK